MFFVQNIARNIRKKKIMFNKWEGPHAPETFFSTIWRFEGQASCVEGLNRGWLWIMSGRLLIWSWLDLVLSNLIIQIVQITKDQIKSFKSTFGGNSDRCGHAMVHPAQLKKHKSVAHARKRTAIYDHTHSKSFKLKCLKYKSVIETECTD